MRMDPTVRHDRKRSSGFGLIESMISIVVLTIGLVGLLSVFSFALATAQSSQQDMIAKQLADSAMESIFTARETAQLQWLQIQNVGAGTTPDGIFLTGFQSVQGGGANGILGTTDDSGAEVLRSTGPDGIVGTADDVTTSLSSFQRQIQLEAIAGNPGLRKVTITVRYRNPKTNTMKNYVLAGYISMYR